MNKSLSIIFCLVFSCVTDKQLSEFEDLKVINDTFLQVMDTGFFYRTLPPPPYRPYSWEEIDQEITEPIELLVEIDGEGLEGPDSIELARKRHADDSIYENFNWIKYRQDSLEWIKMAHNPPYDSSNLVILVFDSLFDYGPNEFNKRITTPEMFSQNFNVDSTWRPLVLELIDSVQDERILPLSKIKNRGKYDIQNYSYDTLKNDKIVGKLWYSRVVFNEKRDRGCYYYGFLCGRLCGWGVIVFVEKQNNVWKVVASREMWIS